MAAQPLTQFNPYYNDIILRDANGANNPYNIKLIEAAKEGCSESDKFTGKRGTLIPFLKMLERFSVDFDGERLRRVVNRDGEFPSSDFP